MEGKIETNLVPRWWALALRGLFTILFGILALGWPLFTIELLGILIGVYVLIDGLFAFLIALGAYKKVPYWWTFLIEGFICVLVGIVIFSLPQLTMLVIFLLLAFWAIATGIFKILAASRIKGSINDEWLLILSGIFSILLGLFLITKPGMGIVVIMWFVGIYAILFGVLMFAFAFVVKGWEKEVRKK